jgi:hypothetical protein
MIEQFHFIYSRVESTDSSLYLHTYVYNSIIHNTWKEKAIIQTLKMLNYNMDESWSHYDEWNNTVRMKKTNIIWILSYKVSSIENSQTENRMVVAKVGNGRE